MLLPFPEPEVAMTAAKRQAHGPAAQLPRRARPGWAALLLVLALAACSSAGGSRFGRSGRAEHSGQLR
jgi:hypothetical protein